MRQPRHFGSPAGDVDHAVYLVESDMVQSDFGAADWSPLTVDRMPPDVRQQWEADCPDGATIKAWVIAEIEAQLNLKFVPDEWTIDQITEVQRWLWYQLEQGHYFNRKFLRLETLLHGTLAGKVWTLGQRRCAVCSGCKPVHYQIPSHVMPIRIAPESRQALDAINWAAFQAAIKKRLPADRYDLSKIDRLCVAFTFGLREAKNNRDVDNMAKALQDAFSRALNFDDKHVHHLDILKILGDFKEEYVIVRVKPSHLNDHSDVIMRGSDVNWAGQPLLRLEDFQK